MAHEELTQANVNSVPVFHDVFSRSILYFLDPLSVLILIKRHTFEAISLTYVSALLMSTIANNVVI